MYQEIACANMLVSTQQQNLSLLCQIYRPPVVMKVSKMWPTYMGPVVNPRTKHHKDNQLQTLEI